MKKDLTKNIILIFLILLLAFILRAKDLGVYSLNYDESTSVLDAYGIGGFPSLTKLFDSKFLLENHDFLNFYNHGWLFYWQRLFGHSEYSIRFSSVLFSLMSICMFYILARTCFGIRVALLSCLLLAVSAFHVFYAQLARPYAVLNLITLAIIFYFFKILDKRKEHGYKYYIIYAFLTILNIYFHFTSLLVAIVLLGIFLMVKKNDPQSCQRILTTYSLIVIFSLPIILTLYSNAVFFIQQRIVASGHLNEFPSWAGDRVTLENLLFTFKNFSIGYNLDVNHSLAARMLTAIYFILFLFGCYFYRKNIKFRILLVLFLLPQAITFIFSQFQVCYIDRYFFSVFPLLLIFVSMAILALPSKSIIPIIAMIFILNFFGLKAYYLNQMPLGHSQHVGNRERDKSSQVIDILNQNYRKPDRIIHTQKDTIFPLKFYCRFKSDNAYLSEEIDKGTLIFWEFDAGKYLYLEYNELHPTIKLKPASYDFDRHIGTTLRLWIISLTDQNADTSLQTKQFIKGIQERGFLFAKSWRFEGGVINLFKNKNYGSKENR